MRYETVIRSTFDVSQVSADEFLVMCPFHEDTSQGHMYVNGRTGLYICFSCGQKGHVENAAKEIPPVNTEDVRDRLRAVRNKQRTKKVHTYPEGWLRRFDFETDYWTVERGLTPEVVEKFSLGFDPMENTPTMPLRTVSGEILGVTRRKLDGSKPKYQHPKGFPTGRHLYGAWLLRGESTVGITEGQVDCAKSWSHRVPCVSTMGARITRDQVKVLQHLGVKKVVGLYDNDSAGRKGTVQMYSAFQNTGIRFTAGWYRPYWWVQTPDGGRRQAKDPDELTGPRLRKLYHSGLNIADWIAHTGYSG